MVGIILHFLILRDLRNYFVFKTLNNTNLDWKSKNHFLKIQNYLWILPILQQKPTKKTKNINKKCLKYTGKFGVERENSHCMRVIWFIQYVAPKLTLTQNYAFIKKSTIFTKTWPKCGTHGLFIFTKFRNDCVKIVDFLIKAYFWVSLNWVEHVCMYFPPLILNKNISTVLNSDKD